MLHIHLITLGKLKESFWVDAEKEYLKRLSAFVKLTIHELKEESFTDRDPVTLIKEKEAKKIADELAKIKDSFIITLEEKGKQYSSPQFAEALSKWSNINSTLTFIIGGPVGLHPSIVDKAHTNLSLSPMTFTHQMTRVILLEQIYRGIMIQENRKYHY